MVEVMTPLVSVKQLGEASRSSLAALSLSFESDLEADLEAMSGEVVPMLKRRIGGGGVVMFLEGRAKSRNGLDLC